MSPTSTVQIFYTFRPEPFEQDIWEQLLSSLPPACRRYILSFYHPKDRQDRLLARLLLRLALSTMNCSATLGEFKLDHNQRPFISQDLDFNFSHSGNLIICAISQSNRVGIDVEEITPVNFSDISKFLPSGMQTKTEYTTDQKEFFFDLWTLHESILKADGCGLPLSRKLRIRTDGYFINSNQYFPVKLTFAPGYSCHLATSTMENDFHLHEITSFDCCNHSF